MPIKDLYLYHATDKEHLHSILQSGILAEAPFNNWDDKYCYGKIFLALDAAVAESYVEAQEDSPEEIVVFRIPLKDLDIDFFGRDENNRCLPEETNSCIYLQDIPPELLTICDVNLEPYQDIESFQGTALYHVLMQKNEKQKTVCDDKEHGIM